MLVRKLDQQNPLTNPTKSNVIVVLKNSIYIGTKGRLLGGFIITVR